MRAATVRAMPELADRIRFTERLRLEPIGPGHAKDLWRLHQDEAVAEWHGGRWNLDAAHRNAASFGEAWRTVGVHKWIAYDRRTGELVGRGGLSRWAHEGRERLEVGWTSQSFLLSSERRASRVLPTASRSHAHSPRASTRWRSWLSELAWRSPTEGLARVRRPGPR